MEERKTVLNRLFEKTVDVKLNETPRALARLRLPFHQSLTPVLQL